jgi:hypothetical protein
MQPTEVVREAEPPPLQRTRLSGPCQNSKTIANLYCILGDVREGPMRARGYRRRGVWCGTNPVILSSGAAAESAEKHAKRAVFSLCLEVLWYFRAPPKGGIYPLKYKNTHRCAPASQQRCAALLD